MSTAEEALGFFLDEFLRHGGREFIKRLEAGKTIEAQDFQELDDIFDIKCLLHVVRINKYPRNPLKYKPNHVCLTEDSRKHPCGKKEEVIQFTDNLNANSNEFRYLNAYSGESPNVHGAFWFDYGVPFSGAGLLTFAESKDPGTVVLLS